MRKRNWRFVLAGVFLIVVAIVIFISLSALATQSNDPAMVVQTAGQAAGVAGGIGVALIISGLIGKKIS
ncbi:MAG: hypothetical protein IPG80_16865 [Anaerolineales bacterium]|jgi:hypothetical protein|uniref:hypothetical protein n=1 Tax=Candidatus Villigracilis vicinus TaxID=3140679 RepID=UPI003136E41A|nr:hypothetical protein [Anaerolineales bacterium]MBK7451659.1 hypothetical protein [Anaerolineales bacterium]